jgi:hypothetical protein
MKYPDKTAMVVTHPIFASQAERLARDFGRVYLVIPWQSHSFPTIKAGRTGEGLNGVTKIDSIWGKELDQTDIVIFPDIYFPQEQIRLEKMGKLVWGGRNGEEIEIWRPLCKKVMESVGLPTQEWSKINGMDALRAYLKAHKDQHVKISKWRGTFETFKSDSYDLSEVKLDEIEHAMGCFKHDVELCVEADLPGVEVGTDTWCVDGQYPNATAVGIEAKDVGFCAEFMAWDKIPEPVRRWNEAMAPIFARYGYRGWLSNEIRIAEDHIPYCIDPTCRSPSPPGELLQEFYLNYAEIIWEGANGRMVDPIPAAKYGVEVIMKSSFAESNCQPIEFDLAYANQIKIYNPAVVDGKSYAIPQDEEMQECGAIVGWGDTIRAAMDHMKEAADTVKGYGIKIPSGAVEGIMEQMQEINDSGLEVFTLDSTPKPA